MIIYSNVPLMNGQVQLAIVRMQVSLIEEAITTYCNEISRPV